MLKKQTGFTIVELLIVIVVIGILASVTVVAYAGVKARAHNISTETAVSQFRKALILYATDKGEYPLGGTASACLGEAAIYPSGCYNGSVRSDFNDALRPYMNGRLPSPYAECLTMYSGCRRGAAFSTQNINLDGQTHTWSISYMLQNNARCIADGQAGGTWVSALSTPNSSGYIEQNSGTSLCRLILPDPTKL